METGLASERFDRALEALPQEPLLRADVDSFLRAFGEHIGVAGLALDEDGLAVITIDGEVELTLLHLIQLPGLIVAAPIPDVPIDQPAYLTALFQANMSWPLTRGGIFAMLPNFDEIMLCWMLFPGDRDLERIDREFAEIVEFAKSWTAEIAAARKAEQAADVAVPDDAIKV